MDPVRLVVDPTRSIPAGALSWYGDLRKKKSTWHLHALESLAAHYSVDLDTPWQDLPESFRRVVFEGSGDEKIHFRHRHEGDDRQWSAESVRPARGLIPTIQTAFRKTKSEAARVHYAGFMSQQPCDECSGAGISRAATAVTLGGQTIRAVAALALSDVAAWIVDLRAGLDSETLAIAGEALDEVAARLTFMLNVGLHYLTLDRPAPSLSGGEGQRIRLASQLSGGLTGVLYVLDEPSIGLHARDEQTLIETLLTLRDLGNTVLVVEHDAAMMQAADWLIDLGPGAGVQGGHLMAVGPPATVAALPHSLTGRYLSGSLQVGAAYTTPRPPDGRWLRVVGARLHNLQNLDAAIPLGRLTCVTGVSGSGKSSLINGILYPALARALLDGADVPGLYTRLEGLAALDEVVNITQEPIGRTPRSNPATYSGLYDGIRRLLAATPAARTAGYGPDRFSFNVPGGRCEACAGYGQNLIQMHFLSDVWVRCKSCDGRRFNPATLAIRYHGLTITDILDMDVQMARTFFHDQPRLVRILDTLHSVGLDYITLGQSATTFSGGEAQRIKLARELSRVATGRTLYILDEPTTGLHFADIQRLLDVLYWLVEGGNTVVVIEHNLDVIKTADWILDLGPDGGAGGGHLVVAGPPATVAACPTSHTGRALRPLLSAAHRTERAG